MNNFKITSLKDCNGCNKTKLANNLQAIYNPNNPDVVAWYGSINISSYPDIVRSWVQTYYQYKTPFTSYINQTNRFEDLNFLAGLYNSLPKELQPKNDQLAAVLLATSPEDSLQGRQNKWQLFKDHYALAFFKNFYQDKLPIDVSKNNAYNNYVYWLRAREQSIFLNKNSWFNAILKPIISIFPFLGGVLGGVGEAALNLLNQGGYISGAGFHLGTSKAGFNFDTKNILIFGAVGILVISLLSKKNIRSVKGGN
jgi:hypothetical protein